jgi:hypothetical protein
MSVRIGHRGPAGTYISAPITGRNAGKQIRVGHKLPLGFYGSTTVPVGNSRKSPTAWPQPSPRAQATIMLISCALVTALCVAVGAWPFALIPVGWLGFLTLKGRNNIRKTTADQLVVSQERP